MNLVIKEENYKVQVGADIYSIEYPSFEEAIQIAKDFKELGDDGEESIRVMKKWLFKLGLDDKFFANKAIKAKHISTIWTDLNTVKK